MGNRTTLKIDDIVKGTYECDKIRYGTTKSGRQYACIDFDGDKTTFVQSYNVNTIINIIATISGTPRTVTFTNYTTTSGKTYTRFKFTY